MNNLLEWHSVFLSALVASFCLVSSNQVQSWGAGFVDYGFAFCDVISYALHLLEEDLCLSLEATTIMFEFTISVQCLFTYGYMDIWFILIHIILIKLYRFSDKAKKFAGAQKSICLVFIPFYSIGIQEQPKAT